MIQKVMTSECPRCGSTNLVKNGHNRVDSQQAHCKNCLAYFVLEPKISYTKTTIRTILKAYLERCSLRGLERVFGVTRHTVAKWLVAFIRGLPALRSTLQSARSDDVLEVDEAWSFVGKKGNQRWLWTVMCRRTRQIIAYVIGDHSDETCKRLWKRVPDTYRRCHSYSDFWGAYQCILPSGTHQCVGKETGETAHMKRWYNTLRNGWLALFAKPCRFLKLIHFII